MSQNVNIRNIGIAAALAAAGHDYTYYTEPDGMVVFQFSEDALSTVDRHQSGDLMVSSLDFLDELYECRKIVRLHGRCPRQGNGR